MPNTHRKKESSGSRCLVTCLFIVISSPAAAQPFSTIQTPPDSSIASISNEASLHQLALANLIASNCEIPDLTAGDAGLIAGTAQAVAKQMELSIDHYFSVYVHPAMAEAAAPDACDVHAGDVRDIAGNLRVLGGAVLRE